MTGTCWLCCLMTSSRSARSWSKESGCRECKSFNALINTASTSTGPLALAILSPCSTGHPTLPVVTAGSPEIMAATRAVGKVAILNSGDSSLQSLPSAVELSRQLQKLMLNIKGNFISHEGHEVDYTALKDSDLFREYVERTKALKVVDLGSLERKERIAFFLSIFYAGPPLFLACMQQPDLYLEMSPVPVEAGRIG